MKKTTLRESIETLGAAKNRWLQLGIVGGISLVLATASVCVAAPAPEPAKPNIVFILTDNLGYGEIGVYGGGVTRGAATPQIVWKAFVDGVTTQTAPAARLPLRATVVGPAAPFRYTPSA